MKKLFSLLAAALLIAACTSKEELGTPFQAGQKVTLAASMGANGAKQMPGKQRVAGVDNGSQINLTWNEGDQITVKVGDATATFTLESGAGTAEGTFTGEMPAAGTAYSVIYPANYNESALANQTYTANGFGNGLMKMSTKTAGTLDGGFVLTADNALVAFNFTGEDALSKIVLTNPAANKSYTLGCIGVTLNSVAKVFYFVVPAGTWSNGFVVEVYDASGNVINSFTKEGSVDFSASSAVDMPEQEVEPVQITPGIGVFSVSADKQVTFSPGNLQYTRSTNTWSFASAQYEVIGTDNVIGGTVTSGELGYNKSGTALADKVDLFGWSTSTTNFGVSTSTDDADYSGSFVDWGTNKIGNDAPNTWRTLTYAEWNYLRWERPNYSELCGVAQVNGVNGLIFLPDNWTCPEGVTFKSGFHSRNGVDYYATYQTFTAEQWAKFEAAGALFLPVAGYRNGAVVKYLQSFGSYLSATEYNSGLAYFLYFRSDKAEVSYSNRYLGKSVRLVKDIQGGTTPETPGNVENGHEYVDLGLSIKWATCNVGASTPEEYGDYFAWGEVETKSLYDWSTYKWCNGTDRTMTKYNSFFFYGIEDYKTVLEPADDAAYVHWGSPWRMPRDNEWAELCNECTWEWIELNGIGGYKVTSNKSGYTDKYIFLPASGDMRDDSLKDPGTYSNYWSSDYYNGCYAKAIDFFNNREVKTFYDYRCYGQSIRPVCP